MKTTTVLLIVFISQATSVPISGEGRGIVDTAVGIGTGLVQTGGAIAETSANFWYCVWFSCKDGQPEDVEKFFAEGRKLIFSNKKNVAELFNGYGGTGLGLISRKSGKAILAQDLVHYMCTQMECRPLELTGRAAEDSPVYKYQMLNKKTKEIVAEFESETNLEF